MTAINEAINEAIENYQAQWDRYDKMARYVGKTCEETLLEHAIRGNVQSRAKNPERLHAKLVKLSQKEDLGRYKNANELLRRVGDLSAVRVTTYVETDRATVVDKLRGYFKFIEEPDKKDGKAQSRFYRATHVQVGLIDEDLSEAANKNLANVSCEIQVCSMLAHVYNEIEHDLGYKPFSGILLDRETEALNAIGNIVEAGDTLIAHAIERIGERTKAEQDPFSDQFDFIARSRKLFPDAKRFADNGGPLYAFFKLIDIVSPKDLINRLGMGNDFKEKAKDALIRLDRYLESTKAMEDKSIRYRPDSDSSDLLLALAVLSDDQKVAAFLGSPRKKGRPPRTEYLAYNLHEMLRNGG